MPPRKAPRISSSKAASFIDAMEQQEQAVQRRRLIEQVTSLVKEQPVERLRAVLAILQGQGPEEAVPRFPRAVACLGGDSSKAVPLYMVKLLVAKHVQMSEGRLNEVLGDASTWRHLWLWGIDAEAVSLAFCASVLKLIKAYIS